MLRKLRKDYLVWFLIMLIINTACTKAVQVGPSDYGEINPQDAKHWRFHTFDNKTYSVTNFEVTDSTFVILEVYQKAMVHGEDGQFDRIASSDLPLILHWTEVKSLDKVGMKKEETQAATIVGGVLVLGFLGLLFLLSQIDGFP